jgi:hypothetical protein
MFVKRWLDPKFKKLPPSAKLLLLNLELGPTSNIARLYPLYREAIIEQTGISAKEFDGALKALQDDGWIMVEDGLVWVVNAVRDDAAVSLQNRDHIRAIQKALLSLPDCDLIKTFRKHYSILIGSMGQGGTEAGTQGGAQGG